MELLTKHEVKYVNGGIAPMAIGIGISAIGGARNGARNGGGWSGALKGAALGAAISITGGLAVVTRGFVSLGSGMRSGGLTVVGGTTGGTPTVTITDVEESDE